jgi:hypothetical protein
LDALRLFRELDFRQLRVALWLPQELCTSLAGNRFLAIRR